LELNGDSLKKPLSAATVKENREGVEPDDEYPDDFEDDSEEEVKFIINGIKSFIPSLYS